VLLRIISDVELARQIVLRRRPAEDTTLPELVRNRIRDVFGAELDAEAVVREIIRAVRAEGDAALRRFSIDFDRQATETFEVAPAAIERAWRETPEATRQALDTAASRIRRFHERAMPRSWVEFDGDSTFGQIFRPIARVGVYAPGGRAVYPSTVLMTAVPARVAGVSEIFLATPPGPSGLPHPAILAAAYAAGVDRVFQIGGAQAIAALAYGTESVPTVDKIVGPGNLFVSVAKRRVAALHDRGLDGAYLYGAGDREGGREKGGFLRP